MQILCIDPGTEVSGVVHLDSETMEISRPMPAISNHQLVEWLKVWPDRVMAIEMVASYGMPVGREVFETVLWTGRMMEAFGWNQSYKVYRKDVKMTLCQSPRANDASIRQAIMDRYAPTGGGKTPVIGTKAKPGPLYGVSKHAWSAIGVGIAFLEGEDYQDLAAMDHILNQFV